MAAAPMQRPPYNQQMYHNQQPNPPTPLPPQQSHDYPRIYQQQNQITPSVHYGNYSPSNQHPSYSHHPGHAPAPGHGMSSHSMLLSHPQSQSSYSLQGPTTGHPSIASLTHPKVETSFTRATEQPRPQSGSITSPSSTRSPSSAGPHSASEGRGVLISGAGPGPIPASTPLLIGLDENGVKWIQFDYSKNREKMEFKIRTDVQAVDLEDLTPMFKEENCVYPRACCVREEYKGNRYNYETECNNVGWALAQLNVSLRGKRGLIQRAVDSYRNSNGDPALRSRRVRRIAKEQKRKQSNAAANIPMAFGNSSSAMARPHSMSMNMQHQPVGAPRYQQQTYSMHPHQPGPNHPGGVLHNGTQDVNGIFSHLHSQAYDLGGNFAGLAMKQEHRDK